MRDIVSNIAVASAIVPAVLDADNTPAAVDIHGFNSAMVSIQVGVGGITFSGTNKIEFVLSHSDDDATYAPVDQADVQGVTGVAGGIILALKAAHADPSVTRVGYVGSKRYLKLLADFSGTHGTGTPIAATVIKGNPRSAPVA